MTATTLVSCLSPDGYTITYEFPYEYPFDDMQHWALRDNAALLFKDPEIQKEYKCWRRTGRRRPGAMKQEGKK